MDRNTNVKAAPTSEIDEELIDTLVAISVVAKRLATKLRQSNIENGGQANEQNERIVTGAR